MYVSFDSDGLNIESPPTAFPNPASLIHLVSVFYLKSITGNLSSDKFICPT